MASNIVSKNNLTFAEGQWIRTIAETIAEDTEDLHKFIEEDPCLFERAQFRGLGGIGRLQQSPKVLLALDELRKAQPVQKLKEMR